MLLDTNKRIVADFFCHFERRDVDAVLAMMTEDATWWLNGRSDLYADARSRTKAEMGDAWRSLFAILNGGLAMTILSLTSEGDRVVAEMEAYATTVSGSVYQNGYLMLVTVRDGRITAVREYTDLLRASEAFHAHV